MSRRLLAGLAAAAAMLGAAAPAQAISPTTFPTATTPAVPGSSPARVADAWKLVGPTGASAIQIAPRWVLTADHAGINAGDTFHNAYGSAIVEKRYRPTIGYWENNDDGTDLSLAYLATPIQTGAPFPKLLDEEFDSTLDYSVPGSILGVGFGYNGVTPPQPDTPTVGWSTPWGTDEPGATTGQIGVGGDSGGAEFWYPTPTAAPVLAGVITRNTATSLSAQQSVGGTNPVTHERVTAFMQAAFTEKAGQPNATPPTFTRLTTEAGPLTNLRPAPVSLAYTARTSAISIRPEWTFMPDSPLNVPRTGVHVYLNGVLKATLGPNATTTVLTNLAWLKTYTVRIVPFNANGEAVSTPSWDTFTTFTFL